jgi:hypothetical protein
LQSLKEYLERNPALHEFIAPNYSAYKFSGGWGGEYYRSILGYTLGRLSGVQCVLDLKNIQVPILSTPEKFQQFVDDTPVMTKAVCLVSFSSMLARNKDEHICAAVYEKRSTEDVFYLYDSSAFIPVLEHIKAYFRPEFKLFYPDTKRQSRGTCFLYALEDLNLLMPDMGPLDEPMFGTYLLNPMHVFFPIVHASPVQSFSLPSRFEHDEDELLRTYACYIIGLYEAGQIAGCDPTVEPESIKLEVKA